MYRTIPISNDMPHHAIARAMHHSFPNVKYEIDVSVDGLTDFCIVDKICLLYTSPSPRDRTRSRMPSSA